MSNLIRTEKYGMIPVITKMEYIFDEIIDTILTCDNKFYLIKKSFTGALVAIENKD